MWGRDRSVGIATRYGLKGLGIEFRWGERFSSFVQTNPASLPASYTSTWVLGIFTGAKRPGRVHHPLHLAPRLKKE
jgi:hypothetical protein